MERQINPTGKNSTKKQLGYGQAPLKGHVADFGSDAHYQVLEVDLAEEEMLVCQSYLGLNGRRTIAFVVLFLVLILTLCLQGVQEPFSRPLPAIHRVQTMDQELQQNDHIVLVADDQVDVAVLEDERDALPTMKGSLPCLGDRHAIEVLTHHPESRAHSTIYEVFDVGHVAARRAGFAFEFGVCLDHLVLVGYPVLLPHTFDRFLIKLFWHMCVQFLRERLTIYDVELAAVM